MTDHEIRDRLRDNMITDASQMMVDQVRAQLDRIAASDDPGAALVIQHVDLSQREPRVVFDIVHSSRRHWMPGRDAF